LVDELRDALTAQERQTNGIDPLFIHAIYLINMASDDRTLARRSRNSLVLALEAAARLRAHGVVTHIGSHLGRGFGTVAAQVGAGILNVLDLAPEGIDLILENSAGAGGTIGSSLEELAELLRQAKGHPSVKIALDTAHLCAAGWDLTQPGTSALLAESVQATVGFDRLAVIHANDSKLPPGSRRDRHASIGEGYIGIEGFRFLLKESTFRKVPWICETPDLGSAQAEQRFGSVKRLREFRLETSLASDEGRP
jgi:deoxyribonuclease-4